jgi:hypothetical protein
MRTDERMEETVSETRIRLAAVCVYGNAAIIVALALYFFVAPVVILLFDFADPALRGPGIPQCAWRWHRALTPKYARWARDRMSSGRAESLGTADASGTEWPLFGSVFYLLGTEALQKDWEAHPAGVAPKVYAREAIDAAADLVADPRQAGWVKKHYGAKYLHEDNCFYRMLLICAATSHAKLTGSSRHLALLRDQVETLSAEIDHSRAGVLEDYPGQCYPGDVVCAIAAIKRADAVLGTDHSAFCSRALRGFSGDRLDPATGLPVYLAHFYDGHPLGPSRGCSNSYVTTFGPEVWPEAAGGWYALYEKYFWQHRLWAAGFREWPRWDKHGDWYFDVDSGPVIAGHGTAACAYGIGAARTNGRFDHAWPLSAEALAMSWPLPSGTLAGARILSNATEAPYLGEAGMLFIFTRQPLPGFAEVKGGRLTGYVYVILCAYMAVAAIFVLGAWDSVRRWRRNADRAVPFEKSRLVAWAALMLGAVAIFLVGPWQIAFVSLLLSQFLAPAQMGRASKTAAGI